LLARQLSCANVTVNIFFQNLGKQFNFKQLFFKISEKNLMINTVNNFFPKFRKKIKTLTSFLKPKS
jgi:hypothetical protein